MQIPSTRHHTIPAAMAACAAFLLSLGGLSSAASGNTPPPASALSQDEQALLKNKKYQQGLKDLAAHLPLEASKNFQESLKTKNLSESQRPSSGRSLRKP